MKEDHIQYLRCPKSLSKLTLKNPVYSNGEVESGLLVSEVGEEYPIRHFIPDFTSEEEVSNEISELYDQLWQQQHRPDYESILPEIKMKFQKSARLSQPLEEFFVDKTILDMGCGMGRFTFMASKLGAKLIIAADYSKKALMTAREQSRNPENVCFIRANVLALPLIQMFDYAFSMGVLHHTPDTRVSFEKVVPLVKEGGYLSIYVYKLGSLPRIQWHLRPYTMKMKEKTVERICQFGGWAYNPSKKAVLPVSRLFKALGRWDIMGIGRITFEGLTTPFLWEHSCAEVVNWYVKNGLEVLHATEEVAVTGIKKASN